VLYAADDAHCAFIEVFEQPMTWRSLDRTVIEERSLAVLMTTRPLNLIDLTAEGLARISADARLTTGDHAIAQRWALALFNCSADIDGILYRARHDPSRLTVAVFDRAAESMLVESSVGLLDPHLIELTAGIIETYGYAVNLE